MNEKADLDCLNKMRAHNVNDRNNCSSESEFTDRSWGHKSVVSSRGNGGGGSAERVRCGHGKERRSGVDDRGVRGAVHGTPAVAGGHQASGGGEASAVREVSMRRFGVRRVT